MPSESPERGEITRGTPFPPFNVTSTAVPFFATVVRPYVPFNMLLRNGPFEPKAMWKAAVGGIRALQQMSRGETSTTTAAGEAQQPLQMVSGHVLGHLLLWNADTTQLLTSCQHFNNVTVRQLVVTNSFVYCVVEKIAGGSVSDDSSVYVWNAKTLEMVDSLSMHEDRVLCLSVDEANEYRAATGGADHLIFLWNLKVSTTTPAAKLVGHHSTVTRVLLTEHVLISGGGDGEVRLWDGKSGVCLQAFDGHQGQVGFMEWARKPNAATHFAGSLVTGCHGGFVRTWTYEYVQDGQLALPTEESTASPSARRTNFTLQDNSVIVFSGTFLNKAHKAMVADVAVDDNGIIFSCSPTDGVNLFHVDRKHNVKLNSFSSGVHCIAIDSDRRVLLVGTDSGQLAFFDYKGFSGESSGAGFGDELVTVIAAFQPHLGAITSMVLERGRNSRWSRVITASADSTILTLDFQIDRDATLFGTMSTNKILKTPNGSLLLPLENDHAQQAAGSIGSASLYGLRSLKKIDAAKKSADLHGRRVTAMCDCRFVATVDQKPVNEVRLVVATDDAKLRFFGYQMYQPDEPASPGGSNAPEEFIETGTVLDLNGFVARKMCSAGPYVVLCLQRNVPGARGGAVAIADTRNDTLVTDVLPFSIYPVDASMFLFTRPSHQEPHHHSHHQVNPHPQDAVIAVQMRSGEVIQVAWRNGARTLVMQRTMIAEQYTNQQIDDGLAPQPGRIIASLNTRFEPPRMHLVSVDGAFNLRGVDVPTSATDNSIAGMFFTHYDQRPIIDVCRYPQGDMAMVVALDAPNVFVVGHQGERLFEISYDGSISDCTQPDYQLSRNSITYSRKHRTYVSSDRNSVFAHEHPHCTAIGASVEGRTIAIGYRDGLIQLWDSGTHRVYKRIVAHRSPVAAIWCFGEEKRILSCATSGFLRGDALYSRSLKDKRNQQQQQQQRTSFGK